MSLDELVHHTARWWGTCRSLEDFLTIFESRDRLITVGILVDRSLFASCRPDGWCGYRIHPLLRARFQQGGDRPKDPDIRVPGERRVLKAEILHFLEGAREMKALEAAEHGIGAWTALQELDTDMDSHSNPFLPQAHWQNLGDMVIYGAIL